MSADWTLNIVWWITVVEVPALGGLLLMIWRVKAELESALDTQVNRVAADLDTVRDKLAAHKVEVAERYVSLDTLRDTEGRLTAHLVRIEKKLDTVGYQPGGDLI
mgnify:CR=1 FL=1